MSNILQKLSNILHSLAVKYLTPLKIISLFIIMNLYVTSAIAYNIGGVLASLIVWVSFFTGLMFGLLVAIFIEVSD